jgi:hypothetical protein
MARQPPARQNGGKRRSTGQRRELIPLPKRPYRDSALFHLMLGLLLLLVAWLTGGNLTRAVIWATLYVVVATSWSWWHFRQRLRREAEASAAEAGGSSP